MGFGMMWDELEKKCAGKEVETERAMEEMGFGMMWNELEKKWAGRGRDRKRDRGDGVWNDVEWVEKKCAGRGEETERAMEEMGVWNDVG
ncbi:hypothetical protein RRG08_061944 [Elysia crispata]|uniref:Uncharacterized protein n=1 Tax=Elysia crispata TaxID=231223 RepID=A0AAE1ALQ8_9GAST|nr:hypothetical protein RRG08_061944 [Elysia crispata]